MRVPLLLACFSIMAAIPISCTVPSRGGLQQNSPSRESVVLAPDILPQGIAVGDVTSNSALLWMRTDGSAMVQVEWAPPSVWETVSKIATAVAPVARSPRMTTSLGTDYAATIALQALVPATRYRYDILVGKAEAGKDHLEATLAARGEFTTLPDARTSVPLTFAWTQTAGPTVTLSNARNAAPTFTAPAVSQDTVLTFQLVVNNGTSPSTAATVNVTVQPASVSSGSGGGGGCAILPGGQGVDVCWPALAGGLLGYVWSRRKQARVHP